MRSLAVIPLLLFSATAAHADNIRGTAVTLRTLDKVTARTQDFTVQIGDSFKYGSLTVEAIHCEKRPPEELPETFAFLKIHDAKLDGEGGDGELETVFSGWMFATRPALNALDHGVYDVWVVGCKTPEPKFDNFDQ